MMKVLNVILCHFPWAVLSVDAIDMSGKHEVDLDTNIWKVSLLVVLYRSLMTCFGFLGVCILLRII
jgi:hypothetical protein